MKYLAVILISFIMISSLAAFAESTPAGVDIKGLQVQLKKIQESGEGLRMTLFFERSKEFADAGSVFADMYQDSLADLETKSRNAVETFFGGKDTAQALDEAIRYIGSLKKEDQAAYNLFTEYLLEKMGKAAPAELKKLSDKISGYEIESASVDLKDRGLLDKFKEWYLKRYDSILKKFLEKKDLKIFKRNRAQIVFSIKIWSKLKNVKVLKRIDPETEKAFYRAWDKGTIAGYNEAYAIWPEMAIEKGVNHYIGLCYENSNDLESALVSYKKSIYKEKNYYRESFYHARSLFNVFPQNELYFQKSLDYFDALLKTPPDAEILGDISSEDFSGQCCETVGDLYNSFQQSLSSAEEKEKNYISKIAYMKSVRDIFTKAKYMSLIQQYIVYSYVSIQFLFDDAHQKIENYLEIVRECDFAVSHAAFYENYDKGFWKNTAAAQNSMIAQKFPLSKNEKIFYYTEAGELYDEAAESLSNDFDKMIAAQNGYDAYTEAFNFADSIAEKYEFFRKSIDILEKHEKTLQSCDSKSYLIYKEIEVLAGMIENFSLCDSEKKREIENLFFTKIEYAFAHVAAEDKYYKWVKFEEAIGYFNICVDYSSGTPEINRQYLETAEEKLKAFLNTSTDNDMKGTVRQMLVQTDFYFKRYDVVIADCTAMLGGNSYNISNDFLYQWIGNSYREKASYVSEIEAGQFFEKAENNYTSALANSSSIYSQLAVTKDQALLMARQGKCRQALAKYLELINFMDEQEYIYIYVYHFKMLAKELFKIVFTPDILDLAENAEQTYIASIMFADGTTAETVTAATGWKWIAEGTGTILEQNGSKMKYKAGKDSSCDIITAECNVDLKQVLKIRGDFDANVKISSEISPSIIFISENDEKFRRPVFHYSDNNPYRGPLKEGMKTVRIQAKFINSSIPPIPVKKNLTIKEIFNYEKSAGTLEVSVYYIGENIRDSYILKSKGQLSENGQTYDFFSNNDQSFTMKVFNKQNLVKSKSLKGSEEYDTVEVEVLNKNDKKPRKFVVYAYSEEANLILSNLMYSCNSLLADYNGMKNLGDFRILYNAKGNSVSPIIADVKLKESNAIKKVNLIPYNNQQKNIFISEKFIRISQKEVVVPENTILFVSSKTSSSLELKIPPSEKFVSFKTIYPSIAVSISHDKKFDDLADGATTEVCAKYLYNNAKYSVITDLSITGREFYECLNYSKNIYVSSHGAPTQSLKGTDEITSKFVGLSLDQVIAVTQSENKTEKIDCLTYKKDENGEYKPITSELRLFTPKCIDFEITETKEIVFFNACYSGVGITNNGIELDCTADKFIKKLNPKIYIGWNDSVSIYFAGKFAREFYRLLTTKKDEKNYYTVKEAFLDAKKFILTGDEEDPNAILTQQQIVSYPWIDKNNNVGDFCIEGVKNRKN